MNAVVLTVKYSYVASTKYTRQGVVAVSLVFSFFEFNFLLFEFFFSQSLKIFSKFKIGFKNKVKLF